MSAIRDYLEAQADLPRNYDRETMPEIVDLVREFHASGGVYNEDAERFIKDRAGDLPEHYHHGHDLRHPLTYQLATEIYIAKQVIADNASMDAIAEAQAEGFRPIQDVELQETRYTIRIGKTYCGREVPDFGSEKHVRALKTPRGFFLIPKGHRVNGYKPTAPMLIREGWA